MAKIPCVLLKWLILLLFVTCIKCLCSADLKQNSLNLNSINFEQFKIDFFTNDNGCETKTESDLDCLSELSQIGAELKNSEWAKRSIN